MPSNFVPRGNQSFLPLLVLPAKEKQQERQMRNPGSICKFCGGGIIHDETLGLSCEGCGRMPLTFLCC